MLSDQEVFVQLATHLFKQGGPTAFINKKLAYHEAATGRKSAIGVMIPDDCYHPALEELNLCELLARSEAAEECRSGRDRRLDNLAKLRGLFDKHFDLICLMEDAHDTVDEETQHFWRSTEDARNYLKGVAAQRRLDAAFLDNLSFAAR